MRIPKSVCALALLLLLAGLLPLTVAAQPPPWTQILLPGGCPDWTRLDGEYYAGTGLAYLMGGRTGTPTDGSIYWFDPLLQTCGDTGLDMPVPISNYTIATVNNGSADLLCTFGGRDNAGLYTTAVQCFDPIAGTVSQVSTLPGQLGLYIPGGSAVVGNIAYVFSGFRNTTTPYHIVETWGWDPVGNSWTQWGDVGLGRGYIDVAVVDGKIYGFGGDVFDGVSLYAQTYAEVFDPATGTWDDAAVADLPQASGEGRAYGFDTASGYEFAGQIVIAGGGQWPAEWAEVEIYDVATDSYDYAFPNLNIQRRDHAGFFVPGLGGNPGTMWVFGGRSSAPGYGGDNPPFAPPEYYPVVQGGAPQTLTCGTITHTFRWDPYGRLLIRWGVQAVDQDTNFVGEVEVTADLTWPAGGPVSRTRVTRLADGIATFPWGSPDSGLWTIDVSNMVRADYTFVDGPQCYAEITGSSNQ